MTAEVRRLGADFSNKHKAEPGTSHGHYVGHENFLVGLQPSTSHTSPGGSPTSAKIPPLLPMSWPGTLRRADLRPFHRRGRANFHAGGHDLGSLALAKFKWPEGWMGATLPTDPGRQD